jgi:hypothetical protein
MFDVGLLQRYGILGRLCALAGPLTGKSPQSQLLHAMSHGLLADIQLSQSRHRALGEAVEVWGLIDQEGKPLMHRTSYWSISILDCVYAAQRILNCVVRAQNHLGRVAAAIHPELYKPGQYPNSLNEVLKNDRARSMLSPTILSLLEGYWTEGGRQCRVLRDSVEHHPLDYSNCYLVTPNLGLALTIQSKEGEVDLLAAAPRHYWDLVRAIEAITAESGVEGRYSIPGAGIELAPIPDGTVFQVLVVDNNPYQIAFMQKKGHEVMIELRQMQKS